MLKILIEDLGEGEEEQVIIRCDKLSDDLLRIIYSAKTGERVLFGYSGEEIHRLQPDDAYYFEAVDNRVFLYCFQTVYETKYKLYELEDVLSGGDFLRVSKSVVLNMGKIKSLRPAFSGRFEAVLDNGEKVIISRQYVPELKKKLGL